MHLISLDKKQWTVQHKLTKQQVDDVFNQHQLTKEQLQEQIQKELYQKFLEGIIKNIPIRVDHLPADNEEVYTLEGFVLTRMNILALIQEILELDDVAKEKFLKEIDNSIKYRMKGEK